MQSAVEITLSGPGKNALGTAMLDDVRRSLRQAGGRPVLLTGSGDAFSAGLDLREVAAITKLDDMCAFLDNLDDAAQELFDYPGPTVACLNGHAIAGGCVLTQCCDIRIAVDNPKLRIGLNEVALGVAFTPVIMAAMCARIPARHHHEVLLAGALYNPQEAVRLGLLDVVSEDAYRVARGRLDALAAHTPEAYAAAKAQIRQGVTDVGQDARRHFHRNLAPMWISDQVRSRLLAALRQ